MEKKETRAEAKARREQARADADWLRLLAERAEAKLPPDKRRPQPRLTPLTKTERQAERAQARANADWLRELAEKGKAELDERKAREA
jgi:hypothetical protein